MMLILLLRVTERNTERLLLLFLQVQSVPNFHITVADYRTIKEMCVVKESSSLSCVNSSFPKFVTYTTVTVNRTMIIDFCCEQVCTCVCMFLL